jgi:hypothetical protein
MRWALLGVLLHCLVQGTMCQDDVCPVEDPDTATYEELV